MNGDRAILHVDMDAFFAAVEQRDNPELRGKPILVGGSGNRGVVTTASYEARPFGCGSAQPMAVARRLCPQAVVVKPRYDAYREASDRVFEILESFTPIVQPISIDEAFLDVTGSTRLHGPPIAIARAIKERIRAEVNLTASIGVSFNKYLAKLASDLEKPDGLVEISRENFDRILPPLPVEKLWGIGPKAAARLHRIGIRTIGDVRAAPAATLERAVGGFAERIASLSRGDDARDVVPDSRARSVSHEQTFGMNLSEPDEVRLVVRRQAEAVARRLRKHGHEARTFGVKIRYGDFQTITRSLTVAEPTNLTVDLQRAADELFDRWKTKEGFKPVRLIGFGATVDETGVRQLDLFPDSTRRREGRIDTTMDAIVSKFGRDSIHRGG